MAVGVGGGDVGVAEGIGVLLGTAVAGSGVRVVVGGILVAVFVDPGVAVAVGGDVGELVGVSEGVRVRVGVGVGVRVGSGETTVTAIQQKQQRVSVPTAKTMGFSGRGKP